MKRRSFFASLLAGLLPAQTTTPPPTVPAYVREFETTIGVPDGSRVLFTLSYAPITNVKLEIFKNGFLMREGAAYDYTFSGRSVWFTRAPQTGDVITAQYYTQ